MHSVGYRPRNCSAARAATPSPPPNKNTRNPSLSARASIASPKSIPATRSQSGIPFRFAKRTIPAPSGRESDARFSISAIRPSRLQASKITALGVKTMHGSPVISNAIFTASSLVTRSIPTPYKQIRCNFIPHLLPFAFYFTQITEKLARFDQKRLENLLTILFSWGIIYTM